MGVASSDEADVTREQYTRMMQCKISLLEAGADPTIDYVKDDGSLYLAQGIRDALSCSDIDRSSTVSLYCPTIA